METELQAIKGGGLRQTAQAFTLENEKQEGSLSQVILEVRRASPHPPANVPFLSLRTPEVLRQLSRPLDDILHLASPQNGT